MVKCCVSLPTTIGWIGGTFRLASWLLKMTVKGPPSLPMTVTFPARAGTPGVAEMLSKFACTCAAVGEAAGGGVGTLV